MKALKLVVCLMLVVATTKAQLNIEQVIELSTDETGVKILEQSDDLEGPWEVIGFVEASDPQIVRRGLNAKNFFRLQPFDLGKFNNSVARFELTFPSAFEQSIGFSELSIAGDLIVASVLFAEQVGDTANNRHAVTVIRRNNDLWDERINIPRFFDSSNFGQSVATNGTWIALGSPADIFAQNARVHIFQLNDNGLITDLQERGSTSRAGFGTHLDMSDEWLAVGAPGVLRDLVLLGI